MERSQPINIVRAQRVRALLDVLAALELQLTAIGHAAGAAEVADLYERLLSLNARLASCSDEELEGVSLALARLTE